MVYCLDAEVGIPMAAAIRRRSGRPKLAVYLHNLDRPRGRLASKLLRIADSIDLFFSCCSSQPAPGDTTFTFKTIFGEVTVERSRISHNQDGTIEIPSATVWNTSHQLAITENLRAAVCDQMSNRSAGKSRADVCQYAGDESLLGRSTVIDIVHQEGEQLTRAGASVPARSWTERRKPSWPCSGPP